MDIDPEYSAWVLQKFICFHYSVLALCIYDFVISIAHEIEVIWSRKLHITTFVYFTARYLPIVNIAYAIAKNQSNPLEAGTPSAPDRCDWATQLVLTLATVSRAGITFTQAARAYAVCNNHRLCVVVFTLLGIVSIAIDCVLVPQCDASLKWVVVFIITRPIFEGAVIIPVLVKLAARFHLMHLKAFEYTSLTGFFLWNSLLFFVAMMVVEVTVPIIFTYLADRAQLKQIGFYIPIIGVFTSRFILGMRHINQRTEMPTENPRPLTTMMFVTRHILSTLQDFGDPAPNIAERSRFQMGDPSDFGAPSAVYASNVSGADGAQDILPRASDVEALPHHHED